MSSLHRDRFRFKADRTQAPRGHAPCPADSWPDWTDDVIFEPSDEDAAWIAEHMGLPQEGTPPGEPRLTFAELIRVKASLLRVDCAGSNFATWLAGQMDRLADLAEILHAETPEEFDGRFEVMELSRSEDLVHCGYTRGYDAAKAEQVDLFGHDDDTMRN